MNTLFGAPATWAAQREREHIMAKRTDANQTEIVAALRKIGATVQPIHEIGKGCPDILVGYAGRNYAIEIKSGTEGLTYLELCWHREWRGQVDIVNSAEDAIDLVTGGQG